MTKNIETPHIKLQIDIDGRLYIRDQITGDRQVIPMEDNADGTKTSNATAYEIEDAMWEFRYDHKEAAKDAPKGKKQAKV